MTLIQSLPLNGLTSSSLVNSAAFTSSATRVASPSASVTTLARALSSLLSQLDGLWSDLAGSSQSNATPTTASSASTGTDDIPAGVGTTYNDLTENASYLAAQLAGGTLQGKTGIDQSNATPGTRFARVANSNEWNAAVARFYAYQFAAYANGDNPLTAQGMAEGGAAAQNMSPSARLFMDVASVYKGNLLNGPGLYNNATLKQLLVQHGLTSLADQPQVGQTDVQTIGAVAEALNEGKLTLQDVINSGAIENMPRYQQVINFVESGQYSSLLEAYDTDPQG